MPNNSRSFFHGLILPLRALRHLLSRPKMLLLALAPLTINLILFSALLYWGFSEFAGMIDGWLAARQGWQWQTLIVLAKILFWPLVLLVVFFIFTPVALLVGAPFYDWLSEKTEEEMGLASPEDEGPLLIALAREIKRTVVAESQKLIFIGITYGALFALNIIPLVGSPLFLVSSVYWTWRWSAFEFVSYAADRRRWPWKKTWSLLKTSPALSLGFGVSAGAALYVPLLNALAVPVLAVAGGMLFAMLNSRSETGG